MTEPQGVEEARRAVRIAIESEIAARQGKMRWHGSMLNGAERMEYHAMNRVHEVATEATAAAFADFQRAVEAASAARVAAWSDKWMAQGTAQMNEQGSLVIAGATMVQLAADVLALLPAAPEEAST